MEVAGRPHAGLANPLKSSAARADGSLVMHPDHDDLHHMLGWNERLPLLAKAQARYMEQLRELGFDTEQAFTLVRDWSQHSWAWSVQPPRGQVVDPTNAAPDESYLLDLPEGGPTEGGDAPREADAEQSGGSVWSDGTASPESWPGEDEIARARRQRRRRWGFRGDDQLDDAA